MSAPPVPEELTKAVMDDLQPVTPLAPVWRRTLWVLAVSALVFAAAVLGLGLRSDLQDIPTWLGWGCSIIEFLAAALLLGLALRESIPGRSLPLGSVLTVLAACIIYQLTVGYITWRFSSGLPWEDHPLAHGMSCMVSDTMLALPTLLVTVWLIVRAYPTRAWMAGMLGGAGAAIASDAITHLQCPVSDMRHVLVWHTGAVIFISAAGALIGLFWGRWRA
ncbi:MAG: NrsF family protein [Acidobacteriota bacterium]